MHEHDLVSVAHGIADAFNAHDVEGILARTSEDCVIVALRSEIEGSFVGPEGVRRWAQAYFDAVPDVRVEIERVEVLPAGRLLILGTQSGTALASRIPFESPLALLAESRGALLKRLEAFPTHGEALAAAGHSDG